MEIENCNEQEGVKQRGCVLSGVSILTLPFPLSVWEAGLHLDD